MIVGLVIACCTKSNTLNKLCLIVSLFTKTNNYMSTVTALLSELAKKIETIQCYISVSMFLNIRSIKTDEGEMNVEFRLE